ncbi:transposase [Streptomyces sp. NPDC096354]|uniref:transposase n=1 Tax=Streptomyces sp. NPDC096354 TaxID=3366088 RepID=UPI00381E3945
MSRICGHRRSLPHRTCGSGQRLGASPVAGACDRTGSRRCGPPVGVIRARRGSRVGRPPRFDEQRNVVERFFNRLKQWRRIATRYDKTAESYRAAFTLASLLMWV